jgi:DeoR family fructose operon transcriptional repressor
LSKIYPEDVVPMFPEERQRRILEQMRSGATVKVTDLSTAFGVSESSIRRDLRDLASSGLLERTHGGALLAESTLSELTFAEKVDQNLAEKVAIARVAADMVQDGDSIILDAGSTTLQIARLLRGRRQLTVVTNALTVAAELGDQPGIDLIVVGGVVKESTMALVGPIAERTLAEINADWVFLGTNGLDLERGLTTPTPIEAAVKRRMIAAARQVVVVADSSKLGRVAFANVAPVSRMHVLITDQGFDRDTGCELSARGVSVHYA